MDRRSARTQGTSRVIRLHEDDGQFDTEFWRGVPAHERLEAVWGLALDYLTLHQRDARERRLQRSVCRVERRGR